MKKCATPKKPVTLTKKERDHFVAWKKAFIAWIRTPQGEEIPKVVVDYYKTYQGVILPRRKPSFG
jgi:hypothetical protein